MATAHLLGRPVPGSVTRSGMPASPRPVNADRIEFSASATAPFWARQHTRLFLGNCGFAREAIDTAQAVVSELTANAFNATGNHSPAPLAYSQLARAGVIGLSLRHFPRFLLIEVIDASPEPPAGHVLRTRARLAGRSRAQPPMGILPRAQREVRLLHLGHPRITACRRPASASRRAPADPRST
jgi:hypothetical protein